jgi:DNA-binding response OmpR family regulator
MTQTILIVDDNRSVQRLVADYLSEHHFRVVAADNGREALFVARRELPDLILLDIMMPVLDGYDFVRTYRREKDTPIILLTAKVEETDKVIGLELGADDYITKPFGMAELLARVRAVLRRANNAVLEPPDILRRGAIVLNQSARTVTVRNQPVTLTPTEFELLATLMAHPQRAFSRLDLLERVKGDTLDGVERSMDVHIRNLRTKIEPDPAQPIYILTVFGFGYRFASDEELQTP